MRNDSLGPLCYVGHVRPQYSRCKGVSATSIRLTPRNRNQSVFAACNLTKVPTWLQQIFWHRRSHQFSSSTRTSPSLCATTCYFVYHLASLHLTSEVCLKLYKWELTSRSIISVVSTSQLFEQNTTQTILSSRPNCSQLCFASVYAVSSVE